MTYTQSLKTLIKTNRRHITVCVSSSPTVYITRVFSTKIKNGKIQITTAIIFISKIIKHICGAITLTDLYQ